ncbi:MAG TPA: serine/threonine-protein kinase [Agriterribacter sp.]|uniref:serine/threonine protein kinase n=1 Tax=Agriterribacter sp. TaxID=2821509 RepID=UPI002CD03D4C|nr:serine/threonine-protein kinase [Agriterribacter sp.]HRQ19105.1 serine/threonine-protein kinase [Agriterribacter sp.]
MKQPSNEAYEILDKIGEGGMGTVYLAKDVMLERYAAIKILNKPVNTSTEQMQARFQQEALALAKLNHPNITHLYAFIPRGDTYWMVMEYVKGNTLEEWLHKKGAMSSLMACSMVSQLLNGLEHAHRKGIIHRDLKPANIMISEEGEVKIMDFGIARIRNSQRLTQQGKSVGTLEYMAPEQIQGKEGDELSDIYATGNILYELLCGHPPFNGDTDYHLMKAKLEEKPPPDPELISKTTPALQQVIFKALEKKSAKRFPSVSAFKAALLKSIPSALLNEAELAEMLKRDVQEKPQPATNYKGMPLSISQRWLSLPAAIRALSATPGAVKLPPIRAFKFENIAAYLNRWNTNKSIVLLIGVVILCAALLTANYYSNRDKEKRIGQSAGSVVSKEYHVALPLNEAPAQIPKNTGIIEEQLAKNSLPYMSAPEPVRAKEDSGKKKTKPLPVEKVKDKESQTPDKNEAAPEEEVTEESLPPTPANALTRPISVPAGKKISVILDQDLSSEEKHKDGAIVRLHCNEDVEAGGRVIIKKGAPVYGKIVDVTPAQGRRKALIGFVIQRVQATDGSSIRLQSERFRLKGQANNVPAVYKEGTPFSVILGKGTVK